MSSVDRVLAILELFDEEHPVWCVEDAAPVIGLSISSTYRYFSSLLQAGMLDSAPGSRYRLGPAIIAYDRKIRLYDPILQAAQPAMKDLLVHISDQQVVILCRLFRDQVMCIHQEANSTEVPEISYERGRLMSLYKGATSKVILAYLPNRARKRLYNQHQTEFAKMESFSSWDKFNGVLKSIRRQGYCVAKGEVDSGHVGIATPIFSNDLNIVGSLSIVGTSHSMGDIAIAKLTVLVKAAAAEISERLAQLK